MKISLYLRYPRFDLNLEPLPEPEGGYDQRLELEVFSVPAPGAQIRCRHNGQPLRLVVTGVFHDFGTILPLSGVVEQETICIHTRMQ